MDSTVTTHFVCTHGLYNWPPGGGQSRLIFLNRLSVCNRLLQTFFQSIVASALFFMVVCWGGGLNAGDAFLLSIERLTLHLAPSSGQHINVSNTLVYDQIPAELQTLPSASVDFVFTANQLMLAC